MDDLVEDLDDFGLGLLGVFFSFTDLALKFMRDALAAGFAGVVGRGGVDIEGPDSALLFDFFMDRLRGRLASATALIDLSEKLDRGASSTTGETKPFSFSALFRVKIALSPPFESFFWTFG